MHISDFIYLHRVLGVDRKICPSRSVSHQEACKVMTNCDSEGQIFLYAHYAMMESFSCSQPYSTISFYNEPLEVPGYTQAPRQECVTENYFSSFSTKTYVVGTQKEPSG